MVIFVITAGCVTTTTRNGRVVQNKPSALKTTVAKFGDSLSSVVAKITPSDEPEPVIWTWAGGIPRDAARSEEIPVCIDSDVVAKTGVKFAGNDIRLVSGTTSAPPAWSISAVNDTSVRTFAELNTAVEAAVQSDVDPVIELTGDSHRDNSVPVKLSSTDLTAIAHAATPEAQPIRLVEDGNSWILIREDGVRCKVMLRREQASGLIHVVMNLKLCWGESRRLPVNVVVRSDREELSCLSVPEILDVLYDDSRKTSSADRVQRFKAIASSDDYVTPVNYRKLEAKLAKEQRLASIRPVPAFAVVGGYAYPGPPVLGDARALSGFLLQPRKYSADEPEHVGWVIFDGRAVQDSEHFEVEIQFEEKTHTVRFRVPTDV